MEGAGGAAAERVALAVAIITMALMNRITGGDGETWTDPVAQACESWDINTRRTILLFLATTAHESAGYRRLIENMKYSAKGLRRQWPHRFTEAEAEDMAYDEFRIAERAYGGRMGNGPEGSGDGFNYRARALIGVTGLDNYRAMSEHLGADLVAEPELLEQPLWAAFASAAFWDVNKCSDAEAAGERLVKISIGNNRTVLVPADFLKVTRIVNGGTTGIVDRLNWLGVVDEAMPEGAMA